MIYFSLKNAIITAAKQYNIYNTTIQQQDQTGCGRGKVTEMWQEQ